MQGGDNALYERLVAIRPADLSLNAWAVKAGVNRMIFNDVRKRGNITHSSLEKLLEAAGVSLAQFEAGDVPAEGARVRTEVAGTGMSVEDVERAWKGAPRQKPIPLVGSAIGGEWTDQVEMTELHLAEVLDYMARPGDITDPGAYAVTTVGNSMWPRFKPGERAIVSPRSPVSIGDDVIVQLVGEGDEASQTAEAVTLVLIKELVRKTAKVVELRQHNPPMTFEVPIDRVAAIHRVRVRV